MKVLIAGGGIAGLSAALALAQKDMDVILLEQDASSEARIQGYGLGISSLGAETLIELGLEADILPHCTRAAENICLLQRDGRVLVTFASARVKERSRQEEFKAGQMEINRGTLRRIMLTALHSAKKVKIQFNAKVVGFDVIRGTDGKHSVHVTLQDGTSLSGDILLGSDGIFSRVRECASKIYMEKGSMHSNTPLRHLGIAWVRGVCPSAPTFFQKWFSTSKGSCIVGMGDTKGTILILEGDQNEDSIRWFLGFRKKEPVDNRRLDRREDIVQEIFQYVDDCWDPLAHQIINETVSQNGPLVFRHLYDRSPQDVASWKMPQPWMPVSLLGDALHPVSSFSFAGGGSQALSDGVAVARALITMEDCGEALRHFEGSIRQRSVDQAKVSKRNTDWIHSGWVGGYTARMVSYFVLRPLLWFLMAFQK